MNEIKSGNDSLAGDGGFELLALLTLLGSASLRLEARDDAHDVDDTATGGSRFKLRSRTTMTTTPVEWLVSTTIPRALNSVLEETIEDYRGFNRYDFKDENELRECVVNDIVSAVDAWAEEHGYRLHPLVAEALSKIQAEHEARAWAEAHGYKDEPLVTEAIIKFQAAQVGKAQAQPAGWVTSPDKL